MGKPWPSGRSTPGSAARTDLQRSRRGKPDSASRGREFGRRKEGSMGLPGLCGARALAMVQALVLQLGQQPCMLSVLLSHHRCWHGRATSRRTSPGCQPGRALQVLGRAMWCLRTISSIQRRICLAPDPKRTMWRMGQLLQHAVQSRRITGAMGMEQRRPRVDRGLFAPPEEMGPRRCLRRSLGQAPALH